MKKLIMVILLLLITALFLMGCAEKRDAAIPIENPSYIIIYNSGTIIYEAYSEDGLIIINAKKIKTTTISFGNTTENWLVYYITQNGRTTKIVDSDSLSIVWE